MKRPTKRIVRVRLLQAGLFLPGLLGSIGGMSGCAGTSPFCNVDNCSVVPPGAQPAPNGTYVRRFREVEAAKAEADDFVIYLNEWFMGGTELGPFGQYHANEIVKRLPFVPFPVLLQANKVDAELNEARRQYVINILKLNGVPEPELRVVVGFPDAEGLYGDEAELIYAGILARGSGAGQGGQFSPFGSRFNQFTPFGTFGSFGGVGGFGSGVGGLGGPGLGIARPGGALGY